MIRTTLVIGLVSTAIVACGDRTNEATETRADSLGENATAATLKYEGTCEFLRECSGPSQGLSEPNVHWGCAAIGIAACDDAGRWVAWYGQSACGQTVKICLQNDPSRCTTALVKDVSIAQSMSVIEGSNGVFDALGLNHTMVGACSGTGEAEVTITADGSAPVPSGDPCAGITYDSYYCGGHRIGGDGRTLYHCVGGVLQQDMEPCTDGCVAVSGNEPDHCATQPTSCSCDGTDLGGNAVHSDQCGTSVCGLDSKVWTCGANGYYGSETPCN